MAGDFEIIKLIVISALVGGLIGIEREKKKTVLAGSRTFMLVSMYGTFAVIISERFNVPGFISASFIGVSLIAVLLGFIKNYKLEDIGITTSVAFLIAFALGLLVGQGMIAESLAASVIVSVILVSKYYLHRFTEHLTHRELINALEFGVIAFVLYPIVPDQPIDPFGVLNPRVLLLLVIVVSTIGFFGFLALRQMGAEKGLPILGAMGSLVNSKAVISALSARGGLDSRLTKPAITGIMLSNIVMLLRNLIIVGVLSFDMLNFMLLPQLTMVLVGLAYLRFQPEKLEEEGTVERGFDLSSPFAIIPAVKFALLFLGMSLAVRY
ncbi:MAG: MgtC/SapB family protein, partial [Candidatus Hydrothermarchaeales archaeon]